jgi:hypothetical protein
MPQSPLWEESGEAPMSFTLVSHTTGEPLEGIRIKGGPWKQDMEREQVLGITDANGRCRVGIPYFRNQDGPFIRFEDPQGAFIVKDTSLVDLRDREIVIKLDSVQ